MLSLLAGPFALTLSGESHYFQTPPAWHDALGLVGNIKDFASHFSGCIAQLDGVAYVRVREQVAGLLSLNLVTGGIAAKVQADDGQRFYEAVDMRTLRERGPWIDIDGFGGDFSVGRWTVLTDRYIYATGGQVFAWQDEARTTETTLAASGVSGLASISPTREPDEVFICFPSGQIYPYNHKTKAVSGPIRYVETNEWCFFSPMLGVFIGVHRIDSVDYLKIWADEVAPTELSVPSLSGVQQPGRVVRATTALTGDHSETCEGFVVGWTSSVGTVLDPFSTTGSDGVATARVRIAPDEAATSMIVEATCVV